MKVTHLFLSISLTEKPTGSGGAKELVEMKIRGINYRS